MSSKKTLSFLAAAALLSLTVSSSHGATVTLVNFGTDTTTNAIANSAGTLLTAGSFAAIGTFQTFSASDVSTANMTAGTFANLATDFLTFGALAAGNWFADGYFQGDVGQAIGATSPFLNKEIFAVFGNGTTLAGSTEVWIGSTGGNFAQDNPVFSATASMDFDLGTLSMLFGDLGPETADAFATQSATAVYKTAGVPEPSRAVLAGLGLLGLFFRRRR